MVIAPPGVAGAAKDLAPGAEEGEQGLGEAKVTGEVALVAAGLIQKESGRRRDR